MLAKPSPQQLAWHDLEVGMYIHFGLETYLGVETDFEAIRLIIQAGNPNAIRPF